MFALYAESRGPSEVLTIEPLEEVVETVEEVCSRKILKLHVPATSDRILLWELGTFSRLRENETRLLLFSRRCCLCRRWKSSL